MLFKELKKKMIPLVSATLLKIWLEKKKSKICYDRIKTVKKCISLWEHNSRSKYGINFAWAKSLNRIAQKTLSAKIIELLTNRFKFMINFKELDEISNAEKVT